MIWSIIQRYLPGISQTSFWNDLQGILWHIISKGICKGHLKHYLNWCARDLGPSCVLLLRVNVLKCFAQSFQRHIKTNDQWLIHWSRRSNFTKKQHKTTLFGKQSKNHLENQKNQKKTKYLTNTTFVFHILVFSSPPIYRAGLFFFGFLVFTMLF